MGCGVSIRGKRAVVVGVYLTVGSPTSTGTVPSDQTGPTNHPLLIPGIQDTATNRHRSYKERGVHLMLNVSMIIILYR